MKLDTKSLIGFLKEHRYKYFDVSLIVNGLYASHCISYRKSFLWDEDLFDETIKWKEDEFIGAYAGKYWIINE